MERDGSMESARASLRPRRSLSRLVEDEVANGTATVADDEHLGFFQKGRDYESVGDAHT